MPYLHATTLAAVCDVPSSLHRVLVLRVHPIFDCRQQVAREPPVYQVKVQLLVHLHARSVPIHALVLITIRSVPHGHGKSMERALTHGRWLGAMRGE